MTAFVQVGKSVLLASMVAATAVEASEYGDVVEELRAEIADLQKSTAERIAALQQQIDELQATAVDIDAGLTDVAIASIRPTGSLTDISGASQAEVYGDFRVRYEHTSSHAGLSARDRGVLRGRVGARYRANDLVTLGARLVTGDANDPNSSDVSMGSFVDDLELSLDLAYINFLTESWSAVAGKFVVPFDTTDLLWDGDVNPYGFAGYADIYDSRRFSLRAAAMYSIVDEAIDADDSDMIGGQILTQYQLTDDWSATLSSAYYDYSIGSLHRADLGDIRDNNLTPDGSAFVSDFDIFDVVASLQYSGLSADWPLTISGHYTHNLGANVPEDTAYAIDLFTGNVLESGDIRIRYGYSVAEKDALLAAFSNDNTTYATNYRQHTFSFDYVPVDGTLLNFTGYYYKRADFSLEDQIGANDFVTRLRFNIHVAF